MEMSANYVILDLRFSSYYFSTPIGLVVRRRKALLLSEVWGICIVLSPVLMKNIPSDRGSMAMRDPFEFSEPLILIYLHAKVSSITLKKCTFKVRQFRMMCTDLIGTSTYVMKLQREWEITYLCISRSLVTLKILLQALLVSCGGIWEFFQCDQKSYERLSQIISTWSLFRLPSHEWRKSWWENKGTVHSDLHSHVFNSWFWFVFELKLDPQNTWKKIQGNKQVLKIKINENMWSLSGFLMHIHGYFTRRK